MVAPSPTPGMAGPPSPDLIKATAKEGASGRGGYRPGAGRKPKSANGAGQIAAPAAPAVIAPPPFQWSEDDAALISETPFDVGYAVTGPRHEHWLKSRDALRASGAHKKLAYLANAYGMKDPKLMVLCVFAAEYLTHLGKASMASWNIYQADRARAEAKAAADKTAGA